MGWSEGCRTAIHVAARGKQLINNMILLSAATRIDSRAARVTYGTNYFQFFNMLHSKFYNNHSNNNFLFKWNGINNNKTIFHPYFNSKKKKKIELKM